MRCNYNLDTQQSAITSTTTVDQGMGGFSFHFGQFIYRSSTGGRRGWGLADYIYHIQSILLFIFFLSHHIYHPALFFGALLRGVANFETKGCM